MVTNFGTDWLKIVEHASQSPTSLTAYKIKKNDNNEILLLKNYRNVDFRGIQFLSRNKISN